MSYRVAIIIPTFNEERYIEACIHSISKQTFSFAEMDVMIVDGRSTDSTRSIVNILSQKYVNVRLLDNPGRIQSIAFNIGLANSDAPYIIRMDAHVEYDPKYVELCIKHLETNPVIGDVGGICITKTRKRGVIPDANKIVCQSKFGIGGAAFRIGAEAGFVDTVPFGAFPRQVVEKIGGMREDLARAEDNEYVSRIHKAGYKVYLDPAIISTYYARDTFRGIIKQMYANGLSIGQLFYVDRTAIGLRHFVPFAFVCSLAISAIGANFFLPFLWFLIAILGAYVTLALCATIMLCVKYGWKYFVVLPPLFFSVHVAYGCGTLVGLFKYAKQYKSK